MMHNKFFVFFAFFLIQAAKAQEGRIFIDGVALDLREPITYCFQFVPLTAKLTGEGEKYLDAFAHFYTGGTVKNNRAIVFDLGVSREWDKNRSLVMRRAKAVRRYLWRKNKIDLFGARVRVVETVTSICDAYICSEP